MKIKETLENAIENIDDKYLEEADLYNRAEQERVSAPGHKRAKLITVAAAAAVVALLAALIVIPAMNKPETPVPAATDPDVTTEKEPDTTEPASELSPVLWATGDPGYFEIESDVYVDPKTLPNGNVSFTAGKADFYDQFIAADGDARFAILISGSKIGDDLSGYWTESGSDENEFQNLVCDFSQYRDDEVRRVQAEKGINYSEASYRVYDDPEFRTAADEFYRKVYEHFYKNSKLLARYQSELIDFISDHSEEVICKLGDDDEGAVAYLGNSSVCVAVVTKDQLYSIDADGRFRIRVKLAYRDYEKLHVDYYPYAYDDVKHMEDSKLTVELDDAFKQAGGEPLKVRIYLCLREPEPDEYDLKYGYGEPLARWNRVLAKYGLDYDSFFGDNSLSNEFVEEVIEYKRQFYSRDDEYNALHEQLFPGGEGVEWTLKGCGIAEITYERALEISNVWEVSSIELFKEYADEDPFIEIYGD